MADDRRRDQLTGLRPSMRRLGPGPEASEPWLESLPADAVFLGFDLRGFKEINNSRGHQFGDRVLVEFARRLEDAVRPWRAYREGGDEFLVATVLADEAEIRKYVADVRASLERPFLGVTVENWAVAAMASLGQSGVSLADAVLTALMTVRRDQSTDLLIVPPDSDGRPPAAAMVLR